MISYFEKYISNPEIFSYIGRKRDRDRGGRERKREREREIENISFNRSHLEAMR
jgi:hypothetical protein